MNGSLKVRLPSGGGGPIFYFDAALYRVVVDLSGTRPRQTGLELQMGWDTGVCDGAYGTSY
jgi:hypothetical protein